MNMAARDRLKGRKTLQVGNFLDEFEKDDVKKQVDIVALFQHFGVGLTKKGKSYLGICPWHDDKSPSLSVDRDKGLYNCFGCGESGDAFSLVEKMKGCDFKASLVFLKEWKGLSLAAPFASKGAEPDEPPAQEKTPSKEVPASDVANEQNVTLPTIAEYYHKRLFENEQALEYLKGRGLDNAGLLGRFQVGFADGSLLEKISDAQKQDLQKQGIITDRGSEHLNNCITFPIFDDLNNVVGFYGRSTNTKAQVKHLYLKGEHKSVFNRKASKVYDEIILAESIIDALSLIKLGFENVQSIYGTNGFTDEHLRILNDDRVKTVICAFDADQAGREASEKIKEKLVGEGFAVKVISPPAKKDWNEYLLSSGDDSTITEFISKAETFKQEPSTDGFSVSKDQLGHVFTVGDIQYRVTGVKDMFISNLRVNIKAALRLRSGAGKESDLKYYDNLDLYSARSRNTFSQNLSREFDIEAKVIEKDIISILEYLEKERDKAFFAGSNTDTQNILTREERELGLSFLQSPDLFQQIVEDMDVLGYVGEDLNKQLMYIAATSRKLADPISVLIVSESASGKSMLVEKISQLIPDEDVLAVTSLSEQALNYTDDLMHKFLDLSEAVHNEIIDHQIREMLSGKRLSRLVTIKDPQSGKMTSHLNYTPAVVSLVMSGTNYDLNPENASRCFVVNTDESKEQTKRIHKSQRSKYSLKRHYEKTGIIPDIIRKHHAAQRLLEPVTIINPFAEYIDFPVGLMRSRRDHDRFIDLIACVCFLRQFQKERKSENMIEYIECDIDDYRIAYDIMVNGVLRSTLLDIPGSTLMLYEELRTMARKLAKERGIEATDVSFIQRDIREHSGFGGEFVKKHLRTLVEYEYIQVTSGKTRGTRRSYRLRADEPLERIDFTMIPDPDEMARLYQQ